MSLIFICMGYGAEASILSSECKIRRIYFLSIEIIYRIITVMPNQQEKIEVTANMTTPMTIYDCDV